MAEMFGSPTGELIYNQEERSALQHALQSEHTLGQIAMQPVALRSAQVKLEKDEIELKQEKEFARMLQETGGGMEAAAEGKPVTLENTLDRLATKAASAGMIDRAGKLATQAADIRSKKSTAANQATQQRLNMLKGVVAQAEMVGQLLGGATDQASWDAANLQYQMYTGTESPFAGIPYSPQVVDRLNLATLSGKERAQLEIARLDKESLMAYRATNLALQKANLERKVIKDEQEADRKVRLDKNGGNKGPVVGKPSAAEIKEVERQMRLADIDTSKISGDSLKTTTFAIASRAKELQRANKALGSSEALAQAFAEAQESGELELETVGGRQIAGYQVGGEKRFKKKGGPVAGTVPPADKRVVGQAYTVNGKKYIWRKGGWEATQ